MSLNRCCGSERSCRKAVLGGVVLYAGVCGTKPGLKQVVGGKNQPRCMLEDGGAGSNGPAGRGSLGAF